MKHSTLKSITKRLKISKGGKVMRRSMGLGHSRANKSSRQRHRRSKEHELGNQGVAARKYFL
ncbi:MAG: hypothetical protein Q7R98_01380 [Candidatus Jorgensenbacteria bacterium]|nr:hypothetical protein [Candidatus Jorgensenbacteria bacterium]